MAVRNTVGRAPYLLTRWAADQPRFQKAQGIETMKSPHQSMMTLAVVLFLMSGGALFAQQPSDADATRTSAQAGSVDEDVRHRQPATRVVESIEHSAKVVRSEPIAAQAEDIENAEEIIDAAEEADEKEEAAQTPLLVMTAIQGEPYSYRIAVETPSPRAWSVHHNRATAYHPHSLAYQPTRFRSYTPKRDWTYHPKRFRKYQPKRDWTYHRW